MATMDQRRRIIARPSRRRARPSSPGGSGPRFGSACFQKPRQRARKHDRCHPHGRPLRRGLVAALWRVSYATLPINALILSLPKMAPPNLMSPLPRLRGAQGAVIVKDVARVGLALAAHETGDAAPELDRAGNPLDDA